MDGFDAGSVGEGVAVAALSADHAARVAGPDRFTRLDRAESLRLLAGMPVGRLIFTSNALPAVRPVQFVFADGLIVLGMVTGGTVASTVHDMIVVLEADDLDPATCSGWSVTVTGRAALVTDPAAIARYQAAPLAPWALRAPDRFMTLTTELVEGIRVWE